MIRIELVISRTDSGGACASANVIRDHDDGQFRDSKWLNEHRNVRHILDTHETICVSTLVQLKRRAHLLFIHLYIQHSTCTHTHNTQRCINLTSDTFSGFIEFRSIRIELNFWPKTEWFVFCCSQNEIAFSKWDNESNMSDRSIAKSFATSVLQYASCKLELNAYRQRRIQTKTIWNSLLAIFYWRVKGSFHIYSNRKGHSYMNMNIFCFFFFGRANARSRRRITGNRQWLETKLTFRKLKWKQKNIKINE